MSIYPKTQPFIQLSNTIYNGKINSFPSQQEVASTICGVFPLGINP